jgi:multidrug efflux pump subunit AcrA (membrane-fusion protein)
VEAAAAGFGIVQLLDRVAAGQLLMKLDTTQAVADTDKARSSRLDAELAAARATALLAAQRGAKAPVVAKVDDAPDARMKGAQRQAEGAWYEYRDQIDGEKARLARRQAELDSTRAEIARLAATAPLARQQADAYRALVADRYVARNDYLDKEQSALDKDSELNARRSHANALVAAIAEQRAQVEAMASKFRRAQLDELEKATQQATQSTNDETKAQTREALMSLTAPVAGTVQQLSVHTLGSAVDEAKQKVALDVWSSYQTLTGATKNAGNSANLLVIATRSHDAARHRYEAGGGNILELMNTQAALANAKQRRVQTLADWDNARIDLAAKLGKLGREDLP